MPAPVSSASARLAAFFVFAVPSTMSSRSSAAPSGDLCRSAPSTSTADMKVSIDSGSCWPATYGIAMQVRVSSSARSGSPASIAVHSLASTRPRIASASPPPGALPAAALGVPALAVAAFAGEVLLDGALRRGRVFLLTAQSYGAPATLTPALAEAPELGVQSVDEVAERDVHGFGQAKASRGLQGRDAVARGPPHPDGMNKSRAV